MPEVTVKVEPAVITDPERWYNPDTLCPSQTERAGTEIEKAF
jgi:hypothetical protein